MRSVRDLVRVTVSELQMIAYMRYLLQSTQKKQDFLPDGGALTFEQSQV